MENNIQTVEEARRAKRRQYRVTYRAAHPEAIKEEKRRWHARAYEQEKQRRTERDAIPEQKQKRLQKNKEYNDAHKEARSAYNREYYARKREAVVVEAPPPAGGG